MVKQSILMTFLADGVKLKDAIAITNVLQQVNTTV
jgi:hypothetical protein